MRTTTWEQEFSPKVTNSRFLTQITQIRQFRTYQTSKNAGMKIERYSAEIARYRMIKHQPEKRNKMRFSLLKTSSKRFL